ncbi:MAG: MFS transporter [Ilumatobacteraceae bacterium]
MNRNATTQRTPSIPTTAEGTAKTMRALELGAFAISGSFMIVFPLLPALQERSGISTSQLGWVAAAGFVAALVAQLVIAPLADRGYERRVLAGAVIAMAFATVLCVVPGGLIGLILGRIGTGVAYGAFKPAATGMAIRLFPDAPGERIGRLQALDLAGMAVGPLLAVAGKIAFGVVPTLVIASALTLLVGLPSLARSTSIVSLVPMAMAMGASERHDGPLAAIGMLRHRSVVAAALIVTAFMIPIGAYDALFPRYLTDLGSSDLMLGIALTAFALPAMLLATWCGRQADRLGPFRAAARGGAANVAVIVAYALVRIPMLIVFIGLVESGGQTLVGAAGAAAMGWAVPGRRAATAQGLGEAVGTIAAAGVALIAAPLYGAGGPTALFLVTAALTTVALSAGVRLGLRSRPVDVGQETAIVQRVPDVPFIHA